MFLSLSILILSLLSIDLPAHRHPSPSPIVVAARGDGDRHREHIGVSQTKQAKKKQSTRPIDPDDIAGSIFSTPERISHDTHLFVIPFGTTDPRQYYPNYRRPIGVSSTSQALPSRRYEDLPLQAIHRARPLSAATPSAIPDDTMSALAPGQKDRLGRVMIQPDGSSWHLVKDFARALKNCVRRLYTQAYHSWSDILNSIHQAMFNNFKTMYTWESRYNLVIGTTFERKASARLSSWLKKVRDSGERLGWMLPHGFYELGQYWNTDKFKAISEQAKKA
ncbi:hypothetical protein H5410_031858 [Solanum commersonii]|uniref:Uncharacterized protein n=1 Tax=Solanum commersonii TaxID=4109 RepID=A0A9J5YLC1_SOLCO|nr:hypothetical protein H5410_031858 [Solanum commersonii]